MRLPVPLASSCLRIATAGLLLASLTACVVVPARPAYGGYGGYGGYAAEEGYRGPPPVVGYVWIDGFWSWQGGRRTWNNGHWGPPGRHWR